MPAPFLTPALFALRAEIDHLFPNRSRVSDGWIGDASHAARHSDHNPELDGSVDAIDITHDPKNGPDCHILAEQIKNDPRLVGGGYIIFDHRISNPDVDNGAWREYDGESPHEEHMHVSVADRLQNDASRWLKEVDEVTEADLNKIRTMIQNNTDVVREIVQNNTDKMTDALQNVALELAAGRKAQTQAIRRAVWASEGKSIEEIRKLEEHLSELDDNEAGSPLT